MQLLNPELRTRLNEVATKTRNINAGLALSYLAVATEASFSLAVTRGCLEFAMATCVSQGIKEATQPK